MADFAFVSYVRADKGQLPRLHKYFATMIRNGQLTAWTDHEILARNGIDNAVMDFLKERSLFIALLSRDYLASNYRYRKDFQYALTLQEQGRLRLIAVILEPCDWQRSPFQRFLFEVAPDQWKPLTLSHEVFRHTHNTPLTRRSSIHEPSQSRV